MMHIFILFLYAAVHILKENLLVWSQYGDPKAGFYPTNLPEGIIQLFKLSK